MRARPAFLRAQHPIVDDPYRRYTAGKGIGASQRKERHMASSASRCRSSPAVGRATAAAMLGPCHNFAPVTSQSLRCRLQPLIGTPTLSIVKHGRAVTRGSAMNKLQSIALTAALLLMTLVGIVVQAHAG